MSWFDGLLWPIMVAVAWIMVQFHSLMDWIGLDPAGGAAWSLSIVGLVLVIRIALIPLFVRQIRASRGLQLLQPEMQAIQKKYKGKTDPASREAMSRETMELYRKHNTNPFSSCLPILLQSPIFFALFRVLNSLTLLSTGAYPRPHIGPLTQELAKQAESASIFGAPLSGTFMRANGNVQIQIVTVVLILAMSATTFTTQLQLTRKNMPKAALEGPMAQQQKMLLYLMPLIFAFSGVNFPIGVLIYWTVSNLWTMGQQFYTIRRMPAPGSQAEAALKERQARRASHGQAAVVTEDRPVIEEAPRGGQRQQPVRKDRIKPKPTAGTAAGSPVSGAVSEPKRVTPAGAGGVSSTAPGQPGSQGGATTGRTPKKGAGSGAGTAAAPPAAATPGASGDAGQTAAARGAARSGGAGKAARPDDALSEGKTEASRGGAPGSSEAGEQRAARKKKQGGAGGGAPSRQE